MFKNEAGYTLKELVEAYGSVGAIPTAAWTFPEDADTQAEIDAAFEEAWAPSKEKVDAVARRYCLDADAFTQGLQDKMDARLPWNDIAVCTHDMGLAERALGMAFIMANEEYIKWLIADSKTSEPR